MTNEELHRELWGWMAETGASWKDKWPGWELNDSDSMCFACTEAGWKGFHTSDLVIHCHKCPIDWGVEYIEGYTTCERDGSHYARWLAMSVEYDSMYFDDPEREYVRENLMRLAAIVRDLPWRK